MFMICRYAHTSPSHEADLVVFRSGVTTCISQMLKRLMTVCSSEGVDCSDDGGLEAIIFTAEGDMRQALNNLQVIRGNTTINPM